MKKTLLIVACLWTFVSAFSQQSATKWKATIETQKVFIENKGQFDALHVPGKVLFGTDGHTGVFLFTKTGLSYRIEKRERKDRDGRENIKNDKDKEKDHNVALVSMQWEGANPNVQVTAVDELSSYFNFGMGSKSIDHAKTFKKIVYKNLYPNIDVEYVFHPVNGIEYSLILHPGADISRVKMRYSGAEKLSLSEKGEIHIPTVFGDITDHAPLTYYANDKAKTISSSFVLDKKHVAFKLGDYDNSQTVVIDPWTTTPTLPTGNDAFYIKSDSLGDAYVYGGSAPFTLLKYGPTGGLIWTYSTTWNESSDWFGALAVDRAGNAYITDGDGGSLAKINPAGGLVWLQTSGNALTLSLEYWSMDFNCDQTKLYIGGMRGPFSTFPVGVWYGVVNQMNLTNGTISSYTEVSIVPHTGGMSINEVRSLCMSPNGNIYCLSLDTIASITQALTMNYRQMQSYNYAYYLPYSAGGGTGQGSNNIRATSYFIYTTDGVKLDKRDINTGNILDSVTIPGGATQLNSGVAIDTCGNVYVGSQRSVVKYDANLNQLGIANTPAPVYDVSIGTNGDVLACGPGYAVALAFNACPQVLPICYRIFTANLLPTNTACQGQCSGSATASTINGTGPYKYLWSNGSTTQTINNLCSGNYTVTVTDLSSNTTAVAYTTVASGSAFSSNISASPPACGQHNGKATANITAGGTGPFTYTWTGGGNSQVDSNLAAGTYTVTITDIHSCSTTSSATLSQTSSLTLTPNSSNATCSASNGTASVTVSGSPGPFQYNWSNGQSTSAITGLSAGTYTVTVQDTTISTNIFWTEDFTSGGTAWTLNTAGTILTNGSAANQWIINNDTTGCICGSGNYLHITCNATGLSCIGQGGTCTYMALPSAFGNYTTDVLAISPVISTVGKTNIVLTFNWESLGTPGSDYGLVKLSSDGGVTWASLPTQYLDSSNCSFATVSIPTAYQNTANFRMAFEWINAAGTFGGSAGNPPGFVIDNIKLTATTTAPCPATDTIIVSSTSGITINTNGTPATCGQNTGTATANVTAGTGPFTYLWSNNATSASINNLAGGTYTVTVTGPGNCTVSSSVTVTASGSLNLTATPTATSCGGNNGSATAVANGGVGSYTYAWSNNSSAQTIHNVAPGNYTVTVTANGCSATASALIDTSSAISLTAYGGRAGCVSSGTATVNVNTGNGPFAYLWSTGATASNINSLSAGNYSVTVTGAAGCSASTTVTVISTGTGITLNATASPSTCSSNTGSASVTTSTGNGPFTYLWSNNASTANISNVAGGLYVVTVTGVSGCSATASVAVTATGSLSLTTSSTSTSCGNINGTVSVTASTAGPYTYNWSNGATTDSVSNLGTGTYMVTVQGAVGCSATASAVVSPSGGSVNISAPGAICQGDTATICAPVGYRSYHWNNGDTSQCVYTTQPGNYYVTITDNGNCTATSNHVTVTINTNPTITFIQHNDTLTASGAVSYQWYFNNAPISGATSSVYYATQEGNYYVQGTDGSGCKANSAIQNIKLILGIDPISAASNIKVYPNPLASGNWHLEVTNDWLGGNCEIYDAAGRLVYKSEIKNNRSEFELNVAQGIYLMRINSAQKNYTIKLTKL